MTVDTTTTDPHVQLAGGLSRRALLASAGVTAAAVGLADALVRYGSADLDATSFERSNGRVALVTPVVDAWPLEAPTRRAERAFGLSLDVGTVTHGA